MYMTPAKVDVIIGLDYFLSVIKDGQIKVSWEKHSLRIHCLVKTLSLSQKQYQ